ncbi:4Fe-4S dicluster domain-containing protein [Aminipila butyrica]|uniref:4Fe-4S dicluster domain-containing protein n=1 Tax=Aminipila butyrica TaxID=433296 RepID=A0A858BVC1_9FIRM|nr:4Fe-4S binding protein [Aminipila butyrica]QIB68016.1 4Fe-4S dicluster domain-containing protein [Aminipila butyrica]
MAVDYGTLKRGGFMRQKQKNCFSLRLKVVGGHLEAKQLLKIAEISEKYGDGHVHLTSRQGVEIPFIKLADIDEVKTALAEGDCEPGTCGPRVRTVTACQGMEICPSGCVDTYALAQELSERFFGMELPHKFKFGVTGCQNNCLKAEENDIGIKGGIRVTWIEDKCIHCGVCESICRTKAISFKDNKLLLDESKCNYCGRCTKACPVDSWVNDEGYILSFGGLFGNRIHRGEELLPLIQDKETLFRVIDAAVHFFKENGSSGERFRFTIERVGEEIFREKMKEAYHG